jgi:hypothetical protein
MKKLLFILGIFFSITSFAQTGDDVVNALKAGSATQFTGYFSSAVDVKLPQKNEMKNMSKNEASSVVTEFFSSNKITGFELTSQREMSGTMYIAGKLTGGNQSYNLTVMLTSSSKAMSVITVRIS